MARAVFCFGLVTLLSGLAQGQSSDTTSKFEIADVHLSAKDPHHVYGGAAPVNGRFEIHSATMIDLIRVAFGIDEDKILGGPSWLELDRFDVIGKLPASAASARVASAEMTQADGPREVPGYLQMLQTLLTDRFKLVIRKEDRPFPAYVMTAGKKPLLKAADGSGDTGCRVLNAGPFLPGSEIQYSCHNLSVEMFTANLSGILGTQLGGNPVLDRTGLKGLWNIDFSWQLPAFACPKCDMSADDRAHFLEAVDKQLGLKLELQQVPIPVIVVGSVNRTPTDNAPGVREALAPIPVPTEFEVAVIKPTAPDFTGTRLGLQPGGRVVMQGITLDNLLMLAVGTSFNVQYRQWVAGMPDWAQSERFDITAKTPAGAMLLFSDNTLQPALRSLLQQRFGLKTHTEEREVPAYSLVAVKPKMKKGDPAARAHCLNAVAPQGSPAGTVVLNCQNITMEQFADRYVRNFGSAFGSIYAWPPVLDATGLEGGWDFTLTYFQPPVAQDGGGRGGNGPAVSDGPMASDPSGGLTVTEAVEKQLGLKLELRKRMMPITVIDHVEQKPTDN